MRFRSFPKSTKTGLEHEASPPKSKGPPAKSKGPPPKSKGPPPKMQTLSVQCSIFVSDFGSPRRGNAGNTMVSAARGAGTLEITMVAAARGAGSRVFSNPVRKNNPKTNTNWPGARSCAAKTRYPYAVSDHDLENANLVVPLEEPSTCFSYQFRQPEAQERWKLLWLRQPEAQGAVFFLTLLEKTPPKTNKN